MKMTDVFEKIFGIGYEIRTTQNDYEKTIEIQGKTTEEMLKQNIEILARDFYYEVKEQDEKLARDRDERMKLYKENRNCISMSPEPFDTAGYLASEYGHNIILDKKEDTFDEEEIESKWKNI